MSLYKFGNLDMYIVFSLCHRKYFHFPLSSKLFQLRQPLFEKLSIERFTGTLRTDSTTCAK